MSVRLQALISLEPENPKSRNRSIPTPSRRRSSRTKPIRIAFVGRPNAGKSTLINGILEDERFVTGPEAGITRDSVTVAWTVARQGNPPRRHPPACASAPRCRRSWSGISTMETTHSIRFADVVVLVMDPNDAFEKQDVQIANLVIREGRGLVYRDHQVGHGR